MEEQEQQTTDNSTSSISPDLRASLRANALHALIPPDTLSVMKAAAGLKGLISADSTAELRRQSLSLAAAAATSDMARARAVMGSLGSIQTVVDGLKISAAQTAVAALESQGMFRPVAEWAADYVDSLRNSSALLELKAVAASLEPAQSNTVIKAVLESLQGYPQLKGVLASSTTISSLLGGQAFTLQDVVEEFVARTDKPRPTVVKVTDPASVGASFGDAVVLSDHYDVEIVNPEASGSKLSMVPTLLLFNVIKYLLIALALWSDIREGIVDINARLPHGESLAFVRNFIRTELAGKPGDIRLVTGSDVRLRAAPGMKSDVLLLLPKNSVVVVLGKEDRIWLWVSYEHQGYMIEGYVSTKFLKKVRK